MDWFCVRSAGRQGRGYRLRDFCVTLFHTYVHLWLFGCSERQRKQQYLQEWPCFFGHGVLGDLAHCPGFFYASTALKNVFLRKT